MKINRRTFLKFLGISIGAAAAPASLADPAHNPAGPRPLPPSIVNYPKAFAEGLMVRSVRYESRAAFVPAVNGGFHRAPQSFDATVHRVYVNAYFDNHTAPMLFEAHAEREAIELDLPIFRTIGIQAPRWYIESLQVQAAAAEVVTVDIVLIPEKGTLGYCKPTDEELSCIKTLPKRRGA